MIIEDKDAESILLEILSKSKDPINIQTITPIYNKKAKELGVNLYGYPVLHYILESMFKDGIIIIQKIKDEDGFDIQGQLKYSAYNILEQAMK